MREAPVCRSRSNSSGQLLATCLPAWPELGKSWKTKAPRPQALPAEAWGRKARGRRLRGEGRREVSLQPRNTKIMRREGPWGQAGWFRSRYLTLTDATAGRLERSRSHPLPLRCHYAAVCPPTPPGQGRSRLLQANHRQPTREGKGRESASNDWGRSSRWVS